MKSGVMQTASFVAVAVISACGLTACSGETHRELPVVVIDYGQPDSPAADTNTANDNGNDVGGRDTAATDAVHDAGTDTPAQDIPVDTTPCVPSCPAWQRCGPNSCGTGECIPGCKNEGEWCNLETGRCQTAECQPRDCAGRECGSDGCSGFCGANQGKCPDGLFCDYIKGLCFDSCQPDCIGKKCGDDGCGNICAPGCRSGVECRDGLCIDEGKCLASSTELKCVEGSNSASGDTSWNIGTTTSALYDYSEACGSGFYPGPEKAYRFNVEPGMTGTLTVSLSQTFPLMAEFLDVMLIEDTGNGCSAASCVAFGASGLTYEVPASETGHKYFLVVDSSTVNNGLFSITIKSCTWNGFVDSTN